MVLSLPITVLAVDNTVNNSVQETVEQVNRLDEDVIEDAQYDLPDSRKKIIKKFLAAMGGVGVSSFAIFVMLTAYNRIRERMSNPTKTVEGDISLESPADIEDAVKVFLDKTRW